MVGVVRTYQFVLALLCCGLLLSADAGATTPGFPPVLLWVSADGGASDLFHGGCPWDIKGGLNGRAFVSVCRPGFYEGKGPYQVALSRPPFDTYAVVVQDEVPVAEPVISPDGNWIAFDVFRPKEPPELDIVRVDGTDRQVLAAAHYSAVWANDSQRLLARNDVTGTLDFIRLSGRITPFARGSSAAWQPHGRLIAFVGPGGRLKIWGANGGSRRVYGPVQSDTLAWSPDGRLLAYVTDTNRNGLAHGLLIWNARTRRTRLLLRYSANRPTWSPDGRQIGVVSSPYVTSVGYDFVKVPRGGGRAWLLYPAISGPLSTAWLRGERIVFVSA